MTTAEFRHDWTRDEIAVIFTQPLMDLLLQAQTVHREYHHANQVQVSTLMSIKTGACPEDCAYCPQAGVYDTGLDKEKLAAISAVVEQARAAKATGATRFCMGAAWREPPAKAMPVLTAMISEVKALGLETCMTLGMLDDEQADTLAEAGLDYYNHNLDTSPEHYGNIITTRTFEDRLGTLSRVRDAGMKVCSGGILGMDESADDRYGLLQSLANLPEHPDSVPVNQLVRVEGTPLENAQDLDPLDFVRTVATARILMPKSVVRLSAGREIMTDEMQALCFMAGANSLFYGETLLTTPNPETQRDQALFKRMGINTTAQGDPVKTWTPRKRSAWEQKVDNLARDASKKDVSTKDVSTKDVSAKTA